MSSKNVEEAAALVKWLILGVACVVIALVVTGALNANGVGW